MVYIYKRKDPTKMWDSYAYVVFWAPRGLGLILHILVCHMMVRIVNVLPLTTVVVATAATGIMFPWYCSYCH